MDAALAALLWPMALTLARVGAFVVTCPMWIPEGSLALARAGLSLALAWVLVLAAPPTTAAMGDVAALLWELAYGALMGLSVRAVLIALSLAGELLDGHIGFSFSHQANPMTVEPAGVVQQFMFALAGLLFFVAGGVEELVAALALSFRTVPPGSVTWSPQMALVLSQRCGALFAVGLRLAAPLAFALAAAQLLLLALTRVAPQLNLWGVGFALTAAVGLVGLFAVLPSWVEALSALWRDAASDLRETWVG